MKFIVLALCLTSLTAFAKTTVKVPAKDILVAARKVLSQTGPFYQVTGKINCVVVNGGWSPQTTTCDITVDGTADTVVVSNAKAIVAKIMKVRPATGPYYEVKGTFVASSISPQMPPFKPSEQASVTLK